MSPGPRRDLTPFVIALLLGAIVLFLLVGGLAYVGRSSGPFHATIDQSFGAQAKLLASESNSVGSQLGTLVEQMTTYRRTQLSETLDSLVAGARSVASDSSLLSATGPGQVGPNFIEAMTNRAVAMVRLRSTLDGLLSITPEAGTSPFPPPGLPAARAVQAVSAIGRMLVAADRSYQTARSEFAKVPGGFLLPRSVWVSQPQLWAEGAVQTTVGQLTSSPELKPFLDVHLVAISLSPAVLPPAPGVAGQPQAPPLPANVSQIPPTCTVSVTAVIRNDGSVVAVKVPIQASVQAVGGGPPFPVNKRVTLGPAASAAVTLPDMPVTPGTTYNIAVAVQVPAGQSRSTGQEGATIAVASFGSAKRTAGCARIPAAAP